MEKTESTKLTVRDAAGVAVTAYIVVKSIQVAATTVVSAVSFRRARKANKPKQIEK